MEKTEFTVRRNSTAEIGNNENPEKSPEILAPVGGKESLVAAVRAGADAVYFGAKGFNARRNAENFESLGEAVGYCHARGVKVYITLNILLLDGEKKAFYETLHEIAESGADAVIVQDLAVAAAVRECCPDLPLHASTQLSVHNAAGALALERLGFRRVVLARELSIDEIRTIAQKTNLQLEVFVHGALCMSVSGMCYLSSILGGRSGNRGLCAQPCRLDFKNPLGRNYALSLRDLSAIDFVDDLKKAGVGSFKIEGRMKRPEYVAAATAAFREKLEGGNPDLSELAAVFSRSGFTQGYLEGIRDARMFGVRTKEDVAASAGSLRKMAALYRKERSSVRISASLRLSDHYAELSVSDGKNEITETASGVQKAEKTALLPERAREQLQKTGETPFLLTEFHFENPDGLTAPVSMLNALRRNALEKLLNVRAASEPKVFIEPKKTESPPLREKRAFPGVWVRFENSAQLGASIKAEKIILPISELIHKPDLIGENTVGEIPSLLFGKAEEVAFSRLRKLKELGLRETYCENIGALYLSRQAGLLPRAGALMNITNTAAVTEYEKLGVISATLSFELRLRAAEEIGGTLPRGILAYGYLPLMHMRSCPLRSDKGCGICRGGGELRDRKGVSFQVLCRGREYSVLLNSVPLYIGDENLQAFDYVLLSFTYEDRKRCEEIFRMFSEGKKADFSRTRGLYFRELL